jgi:hypothetical protein
MDMLRHDHIADNLKVIMFAGPFQGTLKEISRRWYSQIRLPTIAAEGHQMKMSHLLVALRTYNHADYVNRPDTPIPFSDPLRREFHRETIDTGFGVVTETVTETLGRAGEFRGSQDGCPGLKARPGPPAPETSQSSVIPQPEK